MPLRELKSRLLGSPGAKRAAHRALFPKHDYRPRWWVRALVNPFVHTRRGIIRRRARLDLVPFHGFTLGPRALLEDQCLINNVMGDVAIGADALIGVGSTVIGPAVIEDDVLLAQQVVVSALNHGFEDVTQPIRVQEVNTQRITIRRGAWIGAHAIVLPGVTVGVNSVIAAGAVVTKDVPDYAVAVGNPARVVRQYDPATERYERWREQVAAAKTTKPPIHAR